MDQIALLLVLGMLCSLLPMSHLVMLSVTGVMLADTNLVPHKFIYFSRFLPIGILFLRVVIATSRQEQLQQTASLIKHWTPFLVLAGLSVLYSVQPVVSLQRVLSGIFVVIGFGIAMPLMFPIFDEVLVMVRRLALLMAVAVLAGLWFLAGTLGGGETEVTRLSGVFTNPNTLGLLGMQVIFLLLYWWQRERRRFVGKILFGAVVVCAITIIASGSRASTLGAIIGLFVYVWGKARIEGRTLPAVYIFLTVVVSSVLITSIYFPQLFAGLLRSDTSDRLYLWQRAWTLAEGHRLLGLGFGGSDPLFAQDGIANRAQGIYVSGAHSSLMRLVVELGLLGTGLALIAFGTLLVRSWKMLQQGDHGLLRVALLAVTVASLIDSLFEGWLFGFGSGSTIPFWFCFALLCYQTDRAAHSAFLPAKIILQRRRLRKASLPHPSS